MNILRGTVSALSILIGVSPSLAGSGTITVLDSTSTTKTYSVITDGSGNYVSRMGLCDQSAAANCATVDSNHALNISQPTAANLNATVVGTGTFAVQATLQASSATAIGTVNPTTAANWGIGATGAAVPANAQYIGIISGGNLTGWTGAVTQATASNLNATVVQSTASNLNATVVQSTASNLNATVVQPTGTNLHIVCDSGCSGSGGTSSTFSSAFPATGTAAGMSQGGNMVALTGTSGNLNVYDAALLAAANGPLPGMPLNKTYTGCGGTATGTASNAFTATATKAGGAIGNMSADVLWISFTGTATVGGANNSFPLAPLVSAGAGGFGSYSFPEGSGPGGALSVVSAGSSSAYSCFTHN